MDKEVVVKEPSLTRPLKKWGNMTVKTSRARRASYVAELELKESKYTNEKSQVIAYVMKPVQKSKDMYDH